MSDNNDLPTDPNDLPREPLNPDSICRNCQATIESSIIVRAIPDSNDSELVCANCKERIGVLEGVSVEQFILNAIADQVKIKTKEKTAAIINHVKLDDAGNIQSVERQEVKRGGDPED